MELTPLKIAEAFSTGEFEIAIPYISQDAVWQIFGQKTLQGRNAVVEHCRQVADYFSSVETDFKTFNVISNGDRVAINGNARFIREGTTVAEVNACDVFGFKNGLVIFIQSYCIDEVKL